MNKISQSRNISLNDEAEILIDERSTNIPASSFLYALQQTSPKLSLDQYEVLNSLNLAPHLTCNTYAKKLIKLQKGQKLRQFPDGGASEQKPAVERAEKTESASFDEEGFADAEEEIKTPTGWKTPFSGNQKTKRRLYERKTSLWKCFQHQKRKRSITEKLRNSFNRKTRTPNIVHSGKFSTIEGSCLQNKRDLAHECSVAYMDKIAKHNNGVKYPLVAVDVLSRYLHVQPLKTMYAKIALKP